jgi:hypothetical protein
MHHPVIVLAADAAEKSLKICKLQYFGLAFMGPPQYSPCIFTLMLYLLSGIKGID